MKFWGGALVILGGLGTISSINGAAVALGTSEVRDPVDQKLVVVTAERRTRVIAANVIVGAGAVLVLTWGISLYNRKP